MVQSSGRPLLRGRREFALRVIIVMALIAAAAVVCYTADVFLLAFAGILLAVFLDFLAERLAAAAHIGRGRAFAVVAVGISILLGIALWELAPRVADQVSDLIHSLPESFERMRSYLESRQWGRTVLSELPSMLASANITANLTNLLNRIFEGLAALVVIAVAGLYFGASPTIYRRGFLNLFPDHRREPAADVLNEVAYALRWWALGQLVPMTVLGIATTIGLRLLGVRLAFTLGLFTGLMIFIPYIGSVIALGVTLLVALTEGSSMVLYVFLFFIGIHVAEGYLLTPLVQRRAVYLPPGLTILSQVLMGLLLGFIGLALATPLTAAALVLVKMLYLHQRPEHHV